MSSTTHPDYRGSCCTISLIPGLVFGAGAPTSTFGHISGLVANLDDEHVWSVEVENMKFSNI